MKKKTDLRQKKNFIILYIPYGIVQTIDNKYLVSPMMMKNGINLSFKVLYHFIYVNSMQPTQIFIRLETDKTCRQRGSKNSLIILN